MSHDSHSTPSEANSKPTFSFGSAFWLVVILVGLFVAAVNFVSVMSHDDGGHDTGHGAPAHETHSTAPAAEHQDTHGHAPEAPAEEHH